MRRALILLTAMVVALAVCGGVAYPNDHQPPEKPFLYKGEQKLQKGRPQASCWISPPKPNGTYFGECLDYATSYPDVDRVVAGSRLRIRVLKSQKPKTFRVAAWRRLDKNGIPVGRGRRLASSLTPVVRDGKTVAWDVFFRAKRPGRHYYVSASGVWDDAEIENEEQDASWNFHVKTRN